MTDTLTPEQRSRLMSRIRGRDTGIEKIMEGMLERGGIRFVKQPRMRGKPDFLIGEKTLVFCDGDFWHGYDYEKRKPAAPFWRDKIEGNMRRDRLTSRRLRREGYCVLRFWEHDLEKRPEVCMRKILRLMK